MESATVLRPKVDFEPNDEFMQEFEKGIALDHNSGPDLAEAAINHGPVDAQTNNDTTDRKAELIQQLAHSDDGLKVFLKVLGKGDYSADYTAKIVTTMRALQEEQANTVEQFRRDIKQAHSDIDGSLTSLKETYDRETENVRKQGDQRIRELQDHLAEAINRQSAAQAYIKALMSNSPDPAPTRQPDPDPDPPSDEKRPAEKTNTAMVLAASDVGPDMSEINDQTEVETSDDE